jgi:hypothetical protein
MFIHLHMLALWYLAIGFVVMLVYRAIEGSFPIYTWLAYLIGWPVVLVCQVLDFVERLPGKIGRVMRIRL